MMVKAEGSVQGYVERKGKENRVYRSMDLYVKGKDPGNLRLNIPEEHHNLIEICKQSEGKQARASVEIRKFEQTGKIFFDLVGLRDPEVTDGTGGRPVDLTSTMMTVLLLAFLSGLLLER